MPPPDVAFSVLEPGVTHVPGRERCPFCQKAGYCRHISTYVVLLRLVLAPGAETCPFQRETVRVVGAGRSRA